MRVQTKRTYSDTIMSNIDLEKENMMDIFLHTDGEQKFVRLANIDGKLVIFAEGSEDVEVVEWHGSRPFSKKVREVRDELEEKRDEY